MIDDDDEDNDNDDNDDHDNDNDDNDNKDDDIMALHHQRNLTAFFGNSILLKAEPSRFDQCLLRGPYLRSDVIISRSAPVSRDVARNLFLSLSSQSDICKLSR